VDRSARSHTPGFSFGAKFTEAKHVNSISGACILKLNAQDRSAVMRKKGTYRAII
jgi:hypothetical protein